MADEDQLVVEEVIVEETLPAGDPHCGDDCLNITFCGDAIGALGGLFGYCDHDNAENQAKEKAIDDYMAAESISEIDLPEWIKSSGASNNGFEKLHSKIAEWAPGSVDLAVEVDSEEE